MADINIYCDESNHLEADKKPVMALGAVSCPRDKVAFINQRIREIKIEHKLLPDFEVKWTRVTNVRLQFYTDLVNYFFDIDDLSIRILVASKTGLNHDKYKQSHDDWYYKMYYHLLTKIIKSENVYRVCVDRKDTLGKKRVRKLRDILCNAEYDFKKEIIKEVREVHSEWVQLVQLTDLIIGAVQFAHMHTKTSRSVSKQHLVDLIKKRAGRTLTASTLPSESKFNLFLWDGSK
jgi:Protein of unknown function (DUF3800)